jgi:hypothetical protein
MLTNTLTRQHIDLLSSSAQAASQAFADIVLETSNYSRTSMQRGAAFVGKLAAAKGLEDKIQVQKDYVLSSYDAAVDHARSVKSAFDSAFTQTRNGIKSLSSEAIARMKRTDETVAQLIKTDVPNVPVVTKVPTKAPGATKARLAAN